LCIITVFLEVVSGTGSLLDRHRPDFIEVAIAEKGIAVEGIGNSHQDVGVTDLADIVA